MPLDGPVPSPTEGGDDGWDAIPLPDDLQQEQQKQAPALEVAQMKLGAIAKQIVESSPQRHEPGFQPQDVLNPEELQAYNAQLQREAAVSSAATTAQNESSVPTILKPVVMGAKGLLNNVKSTAEMIGLPTEGMAIKPEDIPDVGGEGGKLIENATQLGAGVFGGGAVLKAAKLLQGAGTGVKIARVAAESGIAEASAFDDASGRMLSFLEQHPSFSGPVNDAISAPPEQESQAMTRLKNFVDGAVGGAAAETLFLGVGALRKMAWAKLTGGNKAVQEAAIAASSEQEVRQSYGQVGKVTPLPGVEPAAAEASVEAPKTASPEPISAPSVAPVKPTEVYSDAELNKIVDDIKAPDRPFDPNQDLVINTDNVAGPDELKQVLQTTSSKLAGKIAAETGGVQTWEQTQKMAEDMAADMGSDSSQLWGRIGELAKGADEQAALVLLARKQQNALAKAISQEAYRIDMGTVTDRTRINKLIQNLGWMEQTLTPLRTAQARGTRQWGLVADDLTSARQIKDLIASGGDVSSVMNTVRPTTFGRKLANAFAEMRTAFLISGPWTHVVNTTANTYNMLLRPAQKIVGGTLQGVFNGGNFKFAKEGAAEYYGLARSTADIWSSVAKSFMTEESVLTPRNIKYGLPSHAISAGAFNLSNNSMVGQMLNWTGKATRMGFRLLTTADEMFSQAVYRSNVYARALSEAADMGLTGEEAGQYIAKKEAESFDAYGRGTDQEGLRNANLATFKESLTPNSVTADLSAFAQKHPLIRAEVVPFIKVATNITKQNFQQAPLINFAMSSFREDLAAGGARRAEALGKMATGGMLAMGFIYGLKNWKYSGSGPADPGENKIWAMTHHPNSIEAGGKIYDLNRLPEPAATLISTAINFSEQAGFMQDADLEKLAVATTVAMAKGLESRTWLQGAAQAVDALSQPQDKFAYWFQQQVASSVVPNAITQWRKQHDAYFREVRSVSDAVANATPGLSNKLSPRRDFLGNPIKRDQPAAMGLVNPFILEGRAPQPVAEELARLQDSFKMPSSKINGGRIDLSQFKNAKGQDAYDRLMELRTMKYDGAPSITDKLNELFTDERYKAQPDGNQDYPSSKVAQVRALAGKYLERDMHRLRQEYPDLNTTIQTDEMNAKKVRRDGTAGITPLDQIQKLISPSK